MDLTTPTSVDYAFMTLLAIGLPIWSFFAHKRFEAKLESGDAKALRATYIDTLWMLWIPTLAVLAFWLFMARPFAGLGLSFASTFANGIGLAVALLIIAVLIPQIFQVQRSEDEAAKVLAQIERSPGIKKILPKTSADYALFKGLSVTAGVTEEILFRGYLIWIFSFWMESWLAALLSLVAFVLAHLYQDSKEALVKVALTGGALTLLYMLSGSLIPAIILHAAIDLTSGATCWHARQTCLRATSTT